MGVGKAIVVSNKASTSIAPATMGGGLKTSKPGRVGPRVCSSSRRSVEAARNATAGFGLGSN